MKFTKVVFLSFVFILFLFTNLFAQDYLQLGIEKINKREYRAAIEDLTKAVEKSPKSSKAHFYLGEAYAHTRQIDLAEESFRKATGFDNKYSLAYKRLYDMLTRNGQYKEALDAIQKAVNLDKKNNEYLMELGFAYLNCEMIDEAIKTTSQAQINNPDNPGSYVVLGDAYLKMGVPSMAVDNYKKAIDIDSTYAEAHKKLGDVYYTKLRQYKDALNEYVKYANLDSTNSENMEKVAHLLFFNKLYSNAITFYEKLIKIDPENYMAFTELGASYMYTREYELAAKHLEMAKTLNEKPVEAIRFLASDYLYGKQYQKSVDNFKLLEEIDTLKAEEYQRFAIASLGIQDSLAAIEYYKKVIDLNPDIDVYADIASIFQKQKRNKEAAEFYFKKAEVDTTPNKIKYYIAAGQFYSSEKAYNNAIECFNNALQLDKKDAKIYMYKGLAYQQYPKDDSIKLAMDNFREYINIVDKNASANKEEIKAVYFILGEYEYNTTKNYTRAMGYFDNILRIGETESALMYKGICLMSLNQKEEACKVFDRARKAFPKNKDKAEDMLKKCQCWMFGIQ
jgi:tetratricopeptide (TPR) repeat protein